MDTYIRPHLWLSTEQLAEVGLWTESNVTSYTKTFLMVEED